MSFASDNAAPAHPAMLAALAAANEGVMASYGADEWTQRAERLICETFETECAVFLLATGTAANALSLAALTPPWGAVFAHAHSHVVEDEAGAPEFYTAGARLLTLPGDHARIAPETLAREAGKYSRDWVHGAQPFAVTITQSSEAGTCYAPEDIAEIARICRAHGLKLHMDGARFANACAALKKSPAELTWRAGVDVLSFGATKNGAFACEAIVAFDPDAAAQLPHLRKRAGHLFSKHRWLGAQMCAYLSDGLWLSLAAHANGIAAHLGEGLRAGGLRLLHPVEANEVFVALPATARAALEGADIGFHTWEADGPDAVRLVAAWSSTRDEADRVIALCRAAS